ncbi:DUF6287 domain-containing protein [Streptococcus sp. sy004]|uniref:DUF6287 domain-containing protein n=1 Tax=Streptococcus sp. sy004 TaxID=2600149 RepID=UPI0011B428FE|nr:DUF6287 domain-containing protein [Streptococcus sp. sy004]TWT11196.1 hypothetical protein FRX54_02825 [Streptococcus sp. sy004]
MKKYLTLFSFLLLTACSVKESKESTTTIIETANGSSSQSSTSQNASSSSSVGASSSTVAKESSSSNQSESSSSEDKKANTSSQSSSSQTESSNPSSTVVVDYSLYDSVISAYIPVVNGEMVPSLGEANQVHTSSYYTDIEYSLYDFDQNGVDELTVSLIAKDGYCALLDIFTIKDNQAIILTNDSNLAMLGNRMRLIPLQDGSFYYKGSGSASSAVYAHYRLTADGGALEKVTESMSESDLGKLPEAMDLTTLTWQSVQNKDSQTSDSQTETATGSSMDLQAIMAGDYSSIAGTWLNGKSNKIEITTTDMIFDYPPKSISPWKEFNGYLVGGLAYENSGVGMAIIPAGVTGPSNDSMPDVSDKTKNRISIGQAISTDPNEFYYKVSD